ncbi:hypothetical protein GUITHDRAFT_151524, partial [Guillardia theta CCMP2712]
MNVSAIAMAMQVIQYDPAVIGVFLRSVVQFGKETSEVGEWQRAGGEDAVEYRRMCQKNGKWGSWTNGAALWDRRKLEEHVGRFNEQWGDASEQEYAERVGKKFCAAILRTESGCETSECNAVAVHIGDSRTPGWEPEIEYLGNNRYECLSYGRKVSCS